MDHTIKLWHPEIDQEVATLSGHHGWVWHVAFAENGNALVSASRDGTLKIWRALSWDEIEGAEKARAGIKRQQPTALIRFRAATLPTDRFRQFPTWGELYRAIKFTRKASSDFGRKIFKNLCNLSFQLS